MVRWFGRVILVLVCLPWMLPAEEVKLPTTMPGGVFKGYAEEEDNPHTPGFHKLVYRWQENGQAKAIPFSISLPEGFGTDQQSWPLLTFLAGLGDRGPDPTVSMLVVGHPPQGEWQLVVRVNEHELTRVLVNDQTAPKGWLEQAVDLEAYAGQEARLQLIHQSAPRGNPVAHWGEIKLSEEKLP